MFGDFFLNFWLQRPNEDKDNIENKTNNIRQLGLGRLSTYNLTRRSSLPSGPGGGLTSPRGITAARPPFFILRFGARPLGFIDMSDLKRLRCLLEPCFQFFHFSENNCRTKCFGKTLWAYAFNFFIFPKTAAGPGASEKPCGRML